MTTLRRNAHAVLFPVTTSLLLDDHILSLLDGGGCSVLFGESSEEYASGQMSHERVRWETGDRWQSAISGARARCDALLAAADADISAVHRLHRLTPPLPTLADAQAMSPDLLEDMIHAVGQAARDLGVNIVLSPTADVLIGPNPWLQGRTLGSDVDTVCRITAAYVAGMQRAGVASTLKHFPGHPRLIGPPAAEVATVPGTLSDLAATIQPFRVGIESGARAVMMGPAVFEATRPPVAGSISPQLITMLRDEFGFSGLVMTCDIDHPSTLLREGVEATVIAALGAGADLVLLSPGAVPRIPFIVDAVCDAVERGTLRPERLDAAASAVRVLAASLRGAQQP